VQGPFYVEHPGAFKPEGEEGVRHAAEADMDGPNRESTISCAQMLTELY